MNTILIPPSWSNNNDVFLHFTTLDKELYELQITFDQNPVDFFLSRTGDTGDGKFFFIFRCHPKYRISAGKWEISYESKADTASQTSFKRISSTGKIINCLFEIMNFYEWESSLKIRIEELREIKNKIVKISESIK